MATQPSEMIERVAQALTEEFSFDPAAARLVAYVAIAAMREPTDAMIRLGTFVTGDANIARECWRAMIQAAL